MADTTVGKTTENVAKFNLKLALGIAIGLVISLCIGFWADILIIMWLLISTVVATAGTAIYKLWFDGTDVFEIRNYMAIAILAIGLFGIGIFSYYSVAERDVPQQQTSGSYNPDAVSDSDANLDVDELNKKLNPSEYYSEEYPMNTTLFLGILSLLVFALLISDVNTPNRKSNAAATKLAEQNKLAADRQHEIDLANAKNKPKPKK